MLAMNIAALIADFVTEAEELSAKISADLLALEAARDNPDGRARSYKSMARGLHTLKGSAATLGLAEVAGLAHGMEDVLAPFQRAQAPFPGMVADASRLAALRRMLRADYVAIPLYVDPVAGPVLRMQRAPGR